MSLLQRRGPLKWNRLALVHSSSRIFLSVESHDPHETSWHTKHGLDVYTCFASSLRSLMAMHQWGDPITIHTPKLPDDVSPAVGLGHEPVSFLQGPVGLLHGQATLGRQVNK